MKPITLVLPFPPSVNGYWRTFKNRQILSKRGREYRKSAVLTIMCSKDRPKKPLEGRLTVSVWLYPPTLRRYDVDNFSKGILDALTHAGVWLDDEQVDEIHVYKCNKIKGGEAVVRIED